MADALIPVATYERVSSDAQREKETIKTQTDAIDRFLAQHPEYELTRRYRDDGVSGTLKLRERPDGRQLLADAQAGKFRKLLITRADRLGRDTIDLIESRETLTALHIELVGISEPMDEELTFNIKAVLAREERKRFLARSSEGMDRAAREGRFCGGIVPFGYRVEGVKQTARLVPDENPLWGDLSAADAARRIFELVGIQRWSCYQVANEFNSLGIPTAYVKDDRLVGGKGKRVLRTAGIWRPSRIRALVTNATYKGEYLYGKKSKERDPIPSAVPALVSDELWTAAQHTLADKRLGLPTRSHLLRSRIVCGICGLNFSGVAGRGAKSWYRCNGQIAYRGNLQGHCPGKAIDGDFVEPLVLEDLARFLRHPSELFEELAAEGAEDGPAIAEEADRVSLESELSVLDARRGQAIRMNLEGKISDAEFDEVSKEIAARRESIASRLMAIADTLVSRETTVDEADAILFRVRQQLDVGLSRAQLQELVGLLVRRITVHTAIDATGKKQASLVIEYAFPDPQVTPPVVDLTCTGTG